MKDNAEKVLLSGLEEHSLEVCHKESGKVLRAQEVCFKVNKY